MHVCLIGKGAREAALAWKLKISPLCSKLTLWPGNAGMVGFGEFANLPEKASLEVFGAWAVEQRIDLVVVGPEAPLADGLADALRTRWNIPCFGPEKACAELEASKEFAKEVMEASQIPTAKYVAVYGAEQCRSEALQMLSSTGGVVLKASGLAAGKGVFVCATVAEVEAALARLYSPMLAEAASTVVIEERLEGRECSFFCFLGHDAPRPLGFAVDYKRLKDGDVGPNTGGMGCYTPVEWLPPDAGDLVMSRVVAPLMAELRRRELTYVGCLYVGLMWTASGPKVIEFNVRLGDPEAQVLSVSDTSDWLPLMAAQAGLKIERSPALTQKPRATECAVGVVLASAGYPYGENEKPPVELPQELWRAQGSARPSEVHVQVFCAAVSPGAGENSLKTGNGRVMSVVGRGKNFTQARERAYERVRQIKSVWPHVQFRTDIAANI